MPAPGVGGVAAAEPEVQRSAAACAVRDCPQGSAWGTPEVRVSVRQSICLSLSLSFCLTSVLQCVWLRVGCAGPYNRGGSLSLSHWCACVVVGQTRR